jgi:hypothetical protein
MTDNNPATQETYVVEYHVVLNDAVGERLNGSFQFDGPLPTREALLALIAGHHADLDWNSTKKVLYTVSRLMNNNSHIMEEQGEFSSQELSGISSR